MTSTITMSRSCLEVQTRDSLRSIGRPQPAQMLELERSSDGPDPVHADGPDLLDLLDFLRGAIRTTGTPVKVTAHCQGIDPSLWGKQLAGQEHKHVALHRLARLPRIVQRVFVSAWADAIGLECKAVNEKRRAAVLIIQELLPYLEDA